jgi:hypothetical protein
VLRSSAIPSVEDAANLIEDICRAVVPSGEGEVLAAFDLGEHLEMHCTLCSSAFCARKVSASHEDLML